MKAKLEEYLKSKSIRKKDLVDILDMNYSTIITNFNRGFSSEFIINIANKLPDLDMNWLLKDEEIYNSIKEFPIDSNRIKLNELKLKIEEIAKELAQI